MIPFRWTKKKGTFLFLLKVRDIPGKNRGVVATKKFSAKEFVCEYAGELLNYKEGQIREREYKKDLSAGCYMYLFPFQDKLMW